MYIQINKNLRESSLDSFIEQYSLGNLAIKRFINSGFEDSIRKLGWKISMNNALGFILTKPLESFENITNPGEKMRIIGKHPTAAEFPPVSNKVIFGLNRFRNKYPFVIKRDSVVIFYLRGNVNARRVMLAGSFNDWKPDHLAMQRTDSGWIAMVRLVPGKYWYKFIVDGNWTIDQDNRVNENDGRGNTNSVFYYTNTVFRLNSFPDARRVYLAGSFNNWSERDLPMNKTAMGWELPVYLANGTHTYRFIVDGRWMADPGNPERLPNEFDDFNSVIKIGKPALFRLNGYTAANQVVLTGSFNKWRKDELFMKKTATGWELPYVLGPGNYEYKFTVDGKEIEDATNLATVNNEEGKSYLVLNPNYTFRLKGFNDAKKVFLAGSFNDWSPASLAMKKEGDEWVFSVHLSAGKYLYKFIVDGKWIIDPGNKLWEQNEFGNGNSVLWFGQ